MTGFSPHRGAPLRRVDYGEKHMPLIDTPKDDTSQKRPLWYESDLFTDSDELCLGLASGAVTPDKKAAALRLIDQLQKKFAEMKKVAESI